MASKWQIKHLSHGIRAITGGSTSRSAPLVVLLAGWPETAEAYSSIFEPLSQRHRFVALDPPGLGYSAAPPSYDTKTISQILADAVHSDNTLCEGPEQRYHLVGHDIGSWIAYPWAAQHQSRVRSLTILDAGVPGLLPAPASYPLPHEVNMKLWQFSFNALPELPEILIQGRERELLSWMFKYKTAAAAAHPVSTENFERYVSCYARPGAMSRAFEYYRAFNESASQNTGFAETPLSIPLLALGGSAGGVGDRITQMVAGIAEQVQGGGIEDCGHFVIEEQPEVVSQRLLDFFDSVRL
ncbi:uncharacterized protein TRUGW13939_06475 [Talaromyces rugulosus]|uniref:AB hydrolase-1 domain-containing protein n=1 Tax=Talaromyces rugulosus TaxID=121627 RepID=A0A7H8R0Y8_TALRU|nr:uncharacterized protein TRUGW13939_06475 [Talaromyces rugulosus]QKX59341.1 hypothetical protein TRUGW13939_06475 [Talaromyces rugulosus]